MGHELQVECGGRGLTGWTFPAQGCSDGGGRAGGAMAHGAKCLAGLSFRVPLQAPIGVLRCAADIVHSRRRKICTQTLPKQATNELPASLFLVGTNRPAGHVNSPNSPARDPGLVGPLGSISSSDRRMSAGHASERHGDSEGREPKELAEAVRQGLPDLVPAALEAFFDHYFPRVYGYVRRLVREEHLAEDLTQDVFLHVQRSLPNYDPGRPLSPWVYTIATNKVRDMWRSRRHQEERHMLRIDADEDGGPGPLAREPQPSDRIETREVEDEVRAAVEELPEMLRTTFVLRFYEGLSFEEIGQMVERNEAAVRKRYSRALAELREALSGLSRG